MQLAHNGNTVLSDEIVLPNCYNIKREVNGLETPSERSIPSEWNTLASQQLTQKKGA